MDKWLETSVEKSLAVLQLGGTIIYPTDTIWGIGCDATSRQAVEKIYRIKDRDPSRSMLILAANLEMVTKYVRTIPEKAVEIIRQSSTPVTIIYPQATNLPENLFAGDGSIGIRIPRDEFCLHLLNSFQKPIVSTSANFSGKPFPSCFHDIDKDLLNLVDYVTPYRQDEKMANPPSAIYKIEQDGHVALIRK